jgi:hypothetical protein
MCIDPLLDIQSVFAPLAPFFRPLWGRKDEEEAAEDQSSHTRPSPTLLVSSLTQSPLLVLLP